MDAPAAHSYRHLTIDHNQGSSEGGPLFHSAPKLRMGKGCDRTQLSG